VAVLGDGQRLPVAADGTTPGPATLALRQEDLVLGAAGGAGVQARVRTRVYLGSRNRYVLQLAGIEVKVLTANDQVFDDGATVTLSIEPQRVLCLPR
jgi:putative spermidine/putrescine transport system ATP-binding protein